jgi:hypothetical protein
MPSVTVVDTGLYSTGANPLRYVDFANVGRALGGARRVAPHNGMKKLAGHGTQVSVLAIGGPELLDLLHALDYQPSLRPINIFGRRQEVLYDNEGKPILNGLLPHLVERFYLDHAELFNALEEESGTVVNLSLGRAARIEQLEKLLNHTNPTVYVVAAGNTTYDLEKENVFPAKYGGSGNPGQYNLITVAALDSSGKIAGFSNYGPKHVDIAADGCNVETLAFDTKSTLYQRAKASGTSFAAPQVAMAVSLIRGTTADLGRVVPASMIRMRVLVSSERHPDQELAKKVQDGRVLNLTRAVASIFFDVVEVGGGAGGPIQGYITSGRSFEAFCRVRPTLPQTAILLRITGNASDANKFAFYWTDDKHGRLYEGSCERSLGGELKINDAISGRQHVIPFSKVGDAVFAMFPFPDFQK